MHMLKVSAVIALTFVCTKSIAGQTYVGDGPDSACGGTELKIVRMGHQYPIVQRTVFLSTKTLVEKYRQLSDGDWRAIVQIYSSRWPNAPTRSHLVRSVSFRISDQKRAKHLTEGFPYRDMKWSGEPRRLLDYFHSARAYFQEKA